MAGSVVFEKEYRHTADSEDTEGSSREIARGEVKRALLDELVTYLENGGALKDFKLTRQRIGLFTADVVKMEILEEKWDGKTYLVKARLKADPGEIIVSIEERRKRQRDRDEKETEEARKKVTELLSELVKIRQDLDETNGKARLRWEREYSVIEMELDAAKWFEKGYSFASAGNYTEAIKAFNEALNKNPDFAEADYALGHSYKAIGNYNLAIDAYTRALKLKPESAPAFLGRANAYANVSNYEKAVKDYTAAIRLDPKDALAHTQRGIAYLALGKQNEAIKDLDKAIELSPENAVFYYMRGYSLLKMDSRKKAIKDMKKAAGMGLKQAEDYLKGEGVAGRR